MPWSVGIAVFIQAPAAGHSPNNNVCDGKTSKGVTSKGVSLMMINSQVLKGQVDLQEPLPNNENNRTATLGVVQVTPPAGTLTKAALPGKDLSSKTFWVQPGKDLSSKPSTSALLHPEAASQAQQPYQKQAPLVGAKLLPEFKRVGMLLHDHMTLRLRQWHELAANMGQQRSAAVAAALVGAGVLIFILTFFVWSRAQTGGGRSARSNHPCLGDVVAFAERSQSVSVSRLTSASHLTHRDLSRLLATGPEPEVTEEHPDPDCYFCPDLAASLECECILHVPTNALSEGPFDVTDDKDNVVLHVEPRALNFRLSIVPGGRGAEQRQQHRLVLTREHGTIIAQCGPSLTQARECILLRATGDHFAQITGPEEGTYTLTTCTGLKLFFRGSIKDYAMNVMDNSRRLIANSQRAQRAPIYRLRVAPLMDVGLVLCGVLCIQHIL